jgi:hypothetical protein
MDPLEFHPLADLFPIMTDAELDELGEDMLKHGQREPIWQDSRRTQSMPRLPDEGHRAGHH